MIESNRNENLKEIERTEYEYYDEEIPIEQSQNQSFSFKSNEGARKIQKFPNEANEGDDHVEQIMSFRKRSINELISDQSPLSEYQESQISELMKSRANPFAQVASRKKESKKKGMVKKPDIIKENKL